MRTSKRKEKEMMNGMMCGLERCNEPILARGLCSKHYMRQYRHGDATVTKHNYRMPHCCRYCGTTEPEKFYAERKGICKSCKKMMTIQRGRKLSA
ncbi:MAG: hypothetical protein HYZ34_10010 [Ignavibacteriae bacterium]|nr:hypothetical protein [Ignavibacteriota bacterium]